MVRGQEDNFDLVKNTLDTGDFKIFFVQHYFTQIFAAKISNHIQ